MAELEQEVAPYVQLLEAISFCSSFGGWKCLYLYNLSKTQQGMSCVWLSVWQFYFCTLYVT